MRILFLLLNILLLLPSVIYSQEVKSIPLQSKKQLYSPKHYFITEVVDERDDTTNIGIMRVGIMNKPVQLNIETGAASSVMALIKKNTRQDEEQQKINMRIIQLNVTEKNSGLRQQAEVSFGVAFYDKENKIAEYSGSSYVQTGTDASAYISQLIINNIERCLKEFDKRMQESLSNSGVNTEVTIETASIDKDHFYYSRNAQLNYNDFRGEPDELSIGTAITYSGIGMKYSHGRTGNTVQLKVTLFCYFDRNKSWCRENGKNEKVLNHEQLHFDITALNTCKLAKAIKNFSFSVDNYESELNQLLKNADKEGAALQNAYDKESTHGIKTAEQGRWDEEIRRQLLEINCF